MNSLYTTLIYISFGTSMVILFSFFLPKKIEMGTPKAIHSPIENKTSTQRFNAQEMHSVMQYTKPLPAPYEEGKRASNVPNDIITIEKAIEKNRLHLLKSDTNADGTISPTEYSKSYLGRIDQSFSIEKKLHSTRERLRMMDLNKDGFVDRSEMSKKPSTQ